MAVRRDASKRLGHGESAYPHAVREFPKETAPKINDWGKGAESDSGLFSN
jgi:hypothetical protein